MGKLAESLSKRRPGRPPSYVFDKPDHQLTDLERRLKLSVIKRRLRQNRSYRRRKVLQTTSQEADEAVVVPGVDDPEPSSLAPQSVPTQEQHVRSENEVENSLFLRDPMLNAGDKHHDGQTFVGWPSIQDQEEHANVGGSYFGSSDTSGCIMEPFSLSHSTSPAAIVQRDDAQRSTMHCQLWNAIGKGDHEINRLPENVDVQAYSTGESSCRNSTLGNNDGTSPISLSNIDASDLYSASPRTNLGDSNSVDIGSYLLNHDNGILSDVGMQGDPRAEHLNLTQAKSSIPMFESTSTTFVDPGKQPSRGTGELYLALENEQWMRTHSGNHEETKSATDQEKLAFLEELLQIETTAYVTSSSTLFRLGMSAVASVVASMSPATQAAAAALAIFPESFDACAAAAMLGRNVTALQDLVKHNLLHVPAHRQGSSRYAVNPLVKHVLPSVRLTRQSSLRRSSNLVLKRAMSSNYDNGDNDDNDDNDDDHDLHFVGPAFGISASGNESLDVIGDACSCNTDPVGVDDDYDVLGPTQAELHARFVAHFGRLLSSLSDNPAVNRKGSERLKAMRMFDMERKNLFHALQLSESLGQKIHMDYLRKGAVVMRYCTDAKSRVTFYKHALNLSPTAIPCMWPVKTSLDNKSQELSGENTSNFGDADGHDDRRNYDDAETAPASDFLEKMDPWTSSFLQEFGKELCPELAAKAVEEAENSLKLAFDDCTWQHNFARIQLALGEAYFDMLEVSKAEVTLQNARELLDARGRRSDCRIEVVSMALPNLLLAEIRAARGDTVEAKKLLYYALSLLSHAGLSESTFTVSAMNTLVGTLLNTRCYEDALRTSLQMVDVLSNMGYEHMPIYADALGTLATVHLHMNQPADAERYFCDALEIIELWLGKSGWHKDVPYEHCQDLDIWLLEGLAWACREQGKVIQAGERESQAGERRRQRGLVYSTSFAPNEASSIPVESDVDVIAELNMLLASPDIIGALHRKHLLPSLTDRQPYSRHIY